MNESFYHKSLHIMYILLAVFLMISAKYGLFAPEFSRSVFIGGVSFITIYEDMRMKQKWPWMNILMMLVITVATIYFILEYPEMGKRAGISNREDIIFGILMVGISLISVWKKRGEILSVVAFLFLVYNFAGPFLPGIFSHRGLTLGRVFGFLYNSLYGIYGSVAGIFASYVFMFILFSAFLNVSGGAAFFVRLPHLIAGETKTGTAKAAAVASALIGTVTGSAIANVMATGTFTIPMMKKAGMKDYEAAAIETAASTGAQLMPPVMGAGAFIMAELSGIPYNRIMLVSLAPALLYFISLYVMIDMQNDAIKKIERDRTREIFSLIKTGWFHFVPLILIFVLLLFGYSPVFCAFWSIITIVVINRIFSHDKITWFKIMSAFSEAGKGIVNIGVTAASVGIIIGTVYLTGIGFKFSELILALSMGYLPLAIMMIALASYVLGMGLTVTSSYIILAVLAVPALTEQGISILSAHLIVFWLSQDANITPPVCLAAYAAASIAGADPFKTGISALKYAKIIYIVPFLMAYTPIIDGNFIQIVSIFLISAFVLIMLGRVPRLYRKMSK